LLILIYDTIVNPPSIINYVSKTARVGKNIKIWHFAYVGNDTIIAIIQESKVLYIFLH
jgi:hypothetical protein